MKKFLAQILVAILLICGMAFTLSACGSDGTGQSDSHSEQSTESSKEESSEEGNSSESSGGQNGVWTPPAKE